jgi:hypothetical protein
MLPALIDDEPDHRVEKARAGAMPRSDRHHRVIDILIAKDIAHAGAIRPHAQCSHDIAISLHDLL